MFLPLSYVCAFATAGAAVNWGTPVVRTLALNCGFVDVPSARKVHRHPVVRLGGIAICAGTIAAILLVYGLGAFQSISPEMRLKVTWVILGSIAFFGVGVIDDVYPLPPLLRLLLQIAIASLVWYLGVRVDFITLPGVGLVHLNALSLPITVFWLTGVVNAINWIDGLDGLASGVTGIASAMIFVVCFWTGQTGSALIMAALGGSLLCFLRYNANPAQIFMGDGGSYFIGFLIAGISVIALVKSAAVVAILLPFLILAVPILDMSAVIIARLRSGRSPFVADQRHFHHRLLQAGVPHQLTVHVIYALTFWGGSMAIALAGVPNGLAIFASSTSLLGWISWRAWQSIR
jgi:UDP-GlcNAc:undecaprenyl-phosphate/decaprenyl-phosphate GlcNAc-1-phosphate transferase